VNAAQVPATTPAPSASAPPVGAPLWATLVATFFGIGRLRPGPGTWASAATVVIWATVAYELPPSLRTLAAVALAALVTLVGIPAATRVARAAAVKDPQFVVIDEVAGQWLVLAAAPVNLPHVLLAFLLFRFFDIVKPWPARQLESLPAGARFLPKPFARTDLLKNVSDLLGRGKILSMRAS